MRTRWFVLLLALTLLVLMGTAAGNAPLAEGPNLKTYDVALVQLDEPQAVTQPDGSTVTYRQAYLVRLFGDFPRYTAVVMRVSFGDEQITEYGSFPGGIYFLVYEKSKLTAMAGREVQLGFSRESMVKTGKKFEPERFDLTTPVPLKQALERPAVPAR